jgi:hypothetical protein
MKLNFLEYVIRPVKIYVWLTLLHSLLNLNWKSKNHRFVILILLVYSLTELLNSILVYNTLSIKPISTISVTVSFYLWFSLMINNLFRKSTAKLIPHGFLVLSLCNFFLFEGITSFNHYTFIGGSFIYISFFIYGSFYHLNRENFSLFFSNTYLLLFAPVLYFLGLSFVFGFKSPEVAETLLVGNIKLYDFIGYFVNFIFYTLINIYIYREKKLKHVG